MDPSIVGLQIQPMIYLKQDLPSLKAVRAAIAVASGAAAVFYAIANVAEAGDNIIISDKLYGGTATLATYTLKRFGIEARVFKSSDASDLEGLIDEKTKAIFFESLSNPQIAITDIDAVVGVAKKHGVLTICDNTVATAILCNPIAFGVDVVVHSTSKYTNVVKERHLEVSLLREKGSMNFLKIQNAIIILIHRM